MLSDLTEARGTSSVDRLNAPSGAGCFPTLHPWSLSRIFGSLNAPSGAGCFPTYEGYLSKRPYLCLNAPSGAGCFLTRKNSGQPSQEHHVLMHLLVLGAF